MKAISLWQPWASALASGTKTFETRSWPCPRSIVGQMVAIHAAKHYGSEEKTYTEHFRKTMQLTGIEDDPPRGCIIGVGKIVACHRTELFYLNGDRQKYTMFGVNRGFCPCEEELGNYDPGRFAWEFEDAQKLTTPIPCIGRQGFWNLEPEVEQAIREALR